MTDPTRVLQDIVEVHSCVHLLNCPLNLRHFR